MQHSKAIELQLYALREVLARRWREPQAGESRTWKNYGHQLTTLFDSLLELFKVLQELSLVKDEEAVHYQTLCYEYERLVRAICDDHIGAAKQYILNTSYRDIFVADIEAECRDISDLREVTQRFRLEIDSRSKDRIISFGEKLSCRFMTALLQDRVGLGTMINGFKAN